MIAWIAANAATIIIVLVIAVLAALAFKHVWKNRGGCGCGKSCNGCSACHPDHHEE